jgi:hypothetical protein
MGQSILEKPRVLQLINKLPKFDANRDFVTDFTRNHKMSLTSDTLIEFTISQLL